MSSFLLVVNPSEDFVVDGLVQHIQYFSHDCHQFFHFLSLFTKSFCGNIARNFARHNFFHRKCSHQTAKHNFAGFLLFCVHPTTNIIFDVRAVTEFVSIELSCCPQLFMNIHVQSYHNQRKRCRRVYI